MIFVIYFYVKLDEMSKNKPEIQMETKPKLMFYSFPKV